MRHQTTDVFDAGIKPLQLFYEVVNLRLFKIQLSLIALRDHAPPRKPLPVCFFLEIQISGQFHIAVMIPNQLESKHVLIKLQCLPAVFYDDKTSFKSHGLLSSRSLPRIARAAILFLSG